MTKIETAKKLLTLASKQPSSFGKAVRYGVKYGLVGLRDRFHDELVLDEIVVPADDCGDPGCISGSLKFSVIMPVYNVKIEYLASALASVESQTYANWELCIVDDCSTDPELHDYLKSIRSDNIKVIFSSKNQGISAASNLAISSACGDYICLLDNDDVLHPKALEELFLKASSSHADIMYTDNDVIDECGNRIAAFCKPDWSPDLILSQMYIGHLLAFRRSLYEAIGGFRSEYDGSQDYDFFLRIMDSANCVEHIPELLYSWRAVASSTAANPEAKPYAQTAGLRAIQSYLDSRYGADVCRVEETEFGFVYDVRYPIPEHTTVSIIIPTKDHWQDLKTAIDSIMRVTVFNGEFEIVVLDNNSSDEATIQYLNLISQESKIRVLKAPYSFNWSKLNNQGIREADSDVLVFLNNDIEVLSSDWLTRIAENALRDEIGIVGGLLTYPDGTIQHAGVVIGMGGWADHVYKGQNPVHNGNPFVSPMVTRNVSAVTGACLAVSRDTLATIGVFDEDFIVCGSDVELCLRAEKYGYINLYHPGIRLTHYESKTRDPKSIPAIDFRLSEAMYREFKIAGDKFYNKNLDYTCLSPRLLSRREKLQQEVRHDHHVSIDEIRPLVFSPSKMQSIRINLLIPSVNKEDVYGGISTALKFYERILSDMGVAGRIIVVDCDPREADVEDRFPGYEIVDLDRDSDSKYQIVRAYSRETRCLPVSAGDWFIATAWWTAFCYQNEYNRLLAQEGVALNPLIYLIQDYEPGFYAWSSRHLLAQTTYSSSVPTYAVFNSHELKQYFDNRGYTFEHAFTFDPKLNDQLKDALTALGGTAGKRKQILVYGRPNTDRNAFELLIESLREWLLSYEQHNHWSLVSAGEPHAPVYLGKGRYLTSVGKMDLDDYAKMLTESYAGISLMVSPHPSYPPLEMAAFGVKVITNKYVGKDLSSFSDDVISIGCPTPREIAAQICHVCSSYCSSVTIGNVRESYLDNSDCFSFLTDLEQLIMRYSDSNY